MSFRSSKAVDYFGNSSVDRPPIIPLVGTLAARVSQIPGDIFHSNATQLANCLQKAYRLFEYDAVCTTLDETFLGEALGATVEWDDTAACFQVSEPVRAGSELRDPHEIMNEGRTSVIMDVTNRLVNSLENTAIIGVIPGPVTTTNNLLATGTEPEEAVLESVRTAIGEVARAYGRANADVLMVKETARIRQEIAISSDIDVLEMLDNITDLYDIPLLFAPEDYADVTLNQILEAVSIDGILLDVENPTVYAEQYPEIRVGGGITAQLLSEGTDAIEAQISDLVEVQEDSTFIASGSEIPPDIHPDKLHAVRRGASV